MSNEIDLSNMPPGLKPDQQRCWMRQETFLAALAEDGTIGGSAKAAGIPLATAEDWYHRDVHGFKKRRDVALKTYLSKLEREMDRRGLGYEEPLSYQGRLTGDKIMRYSDNLLMFRAKRIDPAYKDSYQPQQPNDVALKLWQSLQQLAAGPAEATESVDAEFRELDGE